jgi:hypothetical protein
MQIEEVVLKLDFVPGTNKIVGFSGPISEFTVE